MLFLPKPSLTKDILSKLQMKRIEPWKVLGKYGSNAYNIDLPKDMCIFLIFNVKDLIPYKGPEVDEAQYQAELDKEVVELQIHEKIV